ncbi:hypothetical protein N0V90_001988 [Kalmusia sp. IMI 367209]|nr:hypothetical protein N0V90_001988 [Kalmusia sp. IMI 367209]
MTESSYPDYTWRKNGSLWQRDIDEAENFYTCLAEAWKGSGRMFFAITGFLTLSLEVPGSWPSVEIETKIEAALPQAWLKLRYDHPTIASRVEYDHERRRYIKSYRPLDDTSSVSEADAWLQRTFVPLELDVSGLEWCNADPPAPAYPTLFVISSPKESDSDSVVRRDLVIRSPHDIMDGIGTLLLLNNLMAHAARFYDHPESVHFPPAGDEARNLSPPLRVAASIPSTLPPNSQQRLQEVVTKNVTLRTEFDLLTVPFAQETLLPSKHQRTSIEISQAETQTILQGCKQLGATVTHAYHAAIALALRDTHAPSSQTKTKRYISYILVNERPNCTGPYAAPKHPATVYHSVSGPSLAIDLQTPSSPVDPAAQPRAEFLRVVDAVKEYYEAIRSSPSALELAPAFWALRTPAAAHAAGRAPDEVPVPPPNPAPSVSISSMGVVDRIVAPRHGAFSVRDPWVCGEELGTGLGVFLGTWEGGCV